MRFKTHIVKRKLLSEIRSFLLDNQNYLKSNNLFNSALGEWAWIHSTKTKRYVTSIAEDHKVLSDFLKEPLQQSCAYGLITPVETYENLSKIQSNSFLSDIGIIENIEGESSITFLRQSIFLKNEYSRFCKRYKCYSDSPRHLFFANQICQLTDTSKVGIEIGGGYGGLIYYLVKKDYSGKLINCDLLESILISYMYLNLNGVETKLCVTNEQLSSAYLSQAKVILITPNLFSDLETYIPIGFVFNSRSLSEMSQVQVDDYLRAVNSSLKPQFFISENAEEVIFPDSVRHIEITQSSISERLSNYSLVRRYRSKFAGGSNRYGTRVYERLTDLEF